MPHDSSSSRESRTALRVCPLCEATCGLTLTIEGTRVTGARGDRDDVFSRGFICPKGASFGGSTPIPTGSAPPRPQGRRAAGSQLVRGVRRDRDSPARTDRAARAAVGRCRPRQPERAHHGRRALSAHPARHAPHPGPLHREHPRPDAQTRLQRTALRRPERHPGAGHRPHRPSAAPRRQPARIQRQSLHGPRLPRQAQGAAPSRRHPHRGRPPPHPDRPARRPACRHPSRRRRTPARRAHPRAPRGEAHRSRYARRPSRRTRPSSRRRTGVHTRGGRRGVRRGRLDHPYDRPGAGRRPHRRRLRAHRQLHRGARHPRQLARRRPQHPHRQPRPPRWRPLPALRHRPRPRPAAPGKGFALGRWASRVSGHPEAKGELPVAALAEEIETPGTTGSAP